MKKSNIILLSLAGIAVVVMIVMQVYLIKNTQYKEDIEIPLDSFSELEINEGWEINVYNDSINKINMSNDSLKEFYTTEGNKLIIKENKNKKGHKLYLNIHNSVLSSISVFGNSNIYYKINKDIDSLNVRLTGDSYLKIRNNPKDTLEVNYSIQHLSVSLSGKSHLNIIKDIREFTGELNDTSKIYLEGATTIKQLKKSVESSFRNY